ncbi:hypothetical protein ACFVWY_16155 [Streptomyces sp. NPDC058195]|uniref:hypothetical protein n=1 Tax=Streptomyces sp. NPDC058195 TaxID=3346375 RepID=UPI0036E73015
MHRTNLTAANDSASWVGLSLELQRATEPGLRPEAANGNQIVLSQGPHVVLSARIDDDRGGVAYSRTDHYRSPIAPLRATEVRAVSERGQPSWYTRWAHRFADALEASPIGPLHEGRWVLSRRLAREGMARTGDGPARPWRSLLLDEHPDGSIDWFTGSWRVVPLRRMPTPGEGRVKAYRKQAREGILPPALLWWFSGLNCYVVLDGHARLVAALAENREPAVLVLSRAPSGEQTRTGTDRALSAYHLTMSVLDGPHPVTDRQGAARDASRLLATQLHHLAVDYAPTRAWPMPAAHRPGLGTPRV